MSSPAPPPSNGRAIFLTVLLLALIGIPLLGFFVVLIGPGFLGIMAVLAVVGVAHYLLWGRAMEQEAQGEAEEADEPPAEANGWPGDQPQHPRRF